MLFAATISHDLITMGVPVADKVLRTVLVYAGLLLLLRLAGKRDLAQLNSFDLVVLLLLSNVVQNAIIGPDNSLLGGMVGAVVLVAINAVVVRAAQRSERLNRALAGEETTLVSHGQIDGAALRSLALREADVIGAVRRQGASTLAEVETATLMPDGAITVELRFEDANATKGDLAALEAKVDQLLARLS